MSGGEVCVIDPTRADGSFVRFDAVSRTETSIETEDTDFSDIVIMRVRPGTIHPVDVAEGKVPVFPLAEHLVIKADDPCIFSFLLRGHPLDLNHVDHEAKRIVLNPSS